MLGLFLVPSARAATVGSWSPLPSMTTPRYAGAAAALSDGRVLVAGGRDGSGDATASAETYDPVANAWSAVAPMGSARVDAAAASLPGDRVLVTGGDVGGSASASAEIYDGTTNTWSAAAPMASARDGAVAAAVPDGTVWVDGGSSSWASEIYNPATDAWSTAGSVETRTGAAAAFLGGEVLVAGGFDPANPGGLTSWTLDTTTGSQTYFTGTWLPLLYQPSGALLPGGRMLLAGGAVNETSPVASASAEIFDQRVSTWSQAAPLATARYGAAAAALADGRIVVAGGEGSSGPLASAEAFSPPPVPAPAATSGPWIQDDATGTVRVGDMINGNRGSWSDPYSITPLFTYQWQACRSTCENVGPARYNQWGSDYAVTAADVGATLQLVVTANDGGQSVATVSNRLSPVVAPGFHLGIPETLIPTFPGLMLGHPVVLPIPVVRDDTSGAGTVSYRVWDPTPRPYPAFAPMTGVLYFADGERTAVIDVPTQDHAVPILPASLDVQLYNGSPLGVVAPSQVTIPLSDPVAFARDPRNPLGLGADSRSAANPLAGARFFADYFQSLPGRAALAWSASNPLAAAKVAVIAREPNVQRFGAWNGAYPGWNVASYLNRAAAEDPGAVPMISTYRIVSGHCGHWSDPPLAQAAYHTWITSLAEGIGSHPAVLFLEMDSLITAGCLSPAGVTVRMHELRDAISVLANDPHLVVYLDVGAADALPARYAAGLLRRAGIAHIQGFFLNSTHFDWTSREIRYGEQISRLVGGKHFVVNTAENGQGPLRPRHVARQGNEVLCDPVGRGLGPLPTASTGYAKVDAFAWIANPGVSGGQCRAGAPPSGAFWPALALELVRHEDFAVR
ncbi:MAG TPA: glycoside hydrolase family 6 protein [Solirubrobacteraceae bacterium]|nr:glycoside hydrolase family 6 protein [Solirubrobacteraceae bacterium]